MSEKYELIFEEARRLSPEQQWRLAVGLLLLLGRMKEHADVSAQVEHLIRKPEFVALIEEMEREVRREVAEMVRSERANQPQAVAEHGKARSHFGAWDSGDDRSADNERIDRDLAAEYDNSR